MAFQRRFFHKSVTSLIFNPLAYSPPYKHPEHIRRRIGAREVVGYGHSGEPNYADMVDFPFPAIRFKEPTQEINALHELEKGDWKLLSVEDKKELYRASFGQTFSEMTAPSPLAALETIGYGLMLISVGLWMFIAVQVYVWSEFMPDSFYASNKRAQMRRQLEMRVNPITGLSSEWDYEKQDYKNKKWYDPPNPYVSCSDDFM